MSNDSISSIENKGNGSSKRPVKLPYPATGQYSQIEGLSYQ